MKCKDCRYWAIWLFAKFHGDCNSKSIGNFNPANDEELEINTDILTAGSGDVTSFVTGSDFGCTHFDKKDEPEEEAESKKEETLNDDK